ncbi:MAG: fluoride efflux transporter CrcB [Chthoniobacter sp.]|uniref:fluoride efflux transporter CrcB n=1 Tax=Chthoniobacter sp. TaxID=2510640 RepID=UPI0032AAFCAD
MLKTYLAVMLGGAVGTALRFGLSNWFASHYGETFPIGTIVVNVAGCFVIGLFAALTGPDSVLLVSPLTRQMVMIGVLGGFTTFSSFSLQTLRLFNGGEWLRGGWNVLLSVILCLVAVWLGHLTASLIQQR